MNPQYVQYGCGWSAPHEWINFDCSPTLRFERIPVLGKLYTRNAKRFPDAVRIGDITRGLPIEKSSCDAIYCSHILEHLALDDFRTALRNTLSYLKPGAVFRLVLPDMETLARNYLASSDPEAVHHFMESAHLGIRQRPRGLRGVIAVALGNSAHLWMWDEKGMRKELETAGFADIRRAAFGDSELACFKAVEQADRFADALAMQCKRP